MRLSCAPSRCFLYGTGLLQSEDAQSWMRRWWPAEAEGGKRGSSVSNARPGAVIDEACNNGKFVISLDLSLAFDTLHPALAVAWFKHLGLPDKVADMIGSVWLEQRRIMCYGGFASDEIQRVPTSVPQGDGFSLVAMVAVLAGPSEAIKRRHSSLTMRTFVDDRCFADSLQEAMQVKREWGTWSTWLGLRENFDKATHFHRRRRGRVSFLSAGVAPDRITALPKILGVQLQALQKRRISAEEQDRPEEVHPS